MSAALDAAVREFARKGWRVTTVSRTCKIARHCETHKAPLISRKYNPASVMLTEVSPGRIEIEMLDKLSFPPEWYGKYLRLSRRARKAAERAAGVVDSTTRRNLTPPDNPRPKWSNGYGLLR